jgi:hypothetical protein
MQRTSIRTRCAVCLASCALRFARLGVHNLIDGRPCPACRPWHSSTRSSTPLVRPPARLGSVHADSATVDTVSCASLSAHRSSPCLQRRCGGAANRWPPLVRRARVRATLLRPEDFFLRFTSRLQFSCLWQLRCCRVLCAQRRSTREPACRRDPSLSPAH